MTEPLSLVLVFAAGLTSVLSPCVLPVVPIVVSGGSRDHTLRPLLVILGISLTFTIMGVMSSLFGSVIGTKMIYVEKIAAAIIVASGILLIVNVNLFKYLSFLSSVGGRSRGALGGFFLGLTLGIIWIPCVGPMLSGVLAMVASEGNVAHGVGLLLVYSLGFSVPMLLAGYASQWFRSKLALTARNPRMVSAVSGALLVLLGIVIFFKGMVGFGF